MRTKNSLGFVSVLTHAGAVPVLSLREKRASKWPFIFKPFSWRFFGFGQPPRPHQSRKSQPFVKPEADLLVFSNLVTPYSRTRNENVPELELSFGTFFVWITERYGHAVLMNKQDRIERILLTQKQ